IAYQQQNQEKITATKMKLSFVLLSAGMYKEAIDSLSTITAAPLADSVKTEFYSLMARTNYGLADFNADSHYSPTYNELGHRYIDSVLLFSTPDSFESLYYRGLRNVRRMKLQE